MPLVVVITGRPGVGKTTLFKKVVDYAKSQGLTVAGVMALEQRDERNVRVGFRLVDLRTGESSWLALRNYQRGPKVGSYGVVIDEAEKIVRQALESDAVASSDMLGVDEVGPMELLLPSFKGLLLKALDVGKPSVLVVHYRLSDPEILAKLRTAERVEVTLANRERLGAELPRSIVERVKARCRG